MPKYKLLVIAVLVAITTACMAPTQFVKPGGTSVAFDQDRAECTYQAQLHASDNPILWPNIVRSCLTARGWTAQR